MEIKYAKSEILCHVLGSFVVDLRPIIFSTIIPDYYYFIRFLMFCLSSLIHASLSLTVFSTLSCTCQEVLRTLCKIVLCNLSMLRLTRFNLWNFKDHQDLPSILTFLVALTVQLNLKT